MALFQSKLNVCLDNSASAAPVKQRPAKRARDEDDGGGSSSTSKPQSSETSTRATRKKRVKRDEADVVRYACPFCKHNPAKYKHVKTCCGPGWEDVHRVKEHVYRKHSSKNYCQRCMEHFDSEQLLQEHCQSEKPCKLVKNKVADFCSDAKETQLRARAKSGSSEVEKWQEMYKTLFPGERVPSPYYDSTDETTTTSKKSRFQGTEDCREFLRQELPRLVRPLIESYVDSLFQNIQEQVNQKTQEIVKVVETKVLRTFHSFERDDESADPTTPISMAAEQQQLPVQVQHPYSETDKLGHWLADLKEDPGYANFSDNLYFDVEGLLAENQSLIGANLSDSAYYTSSDGDYYSASGGGGGSMAPAYHSQHLS